MSFNKWKKLYMHLIFNLITREIIIYLVFKLIMRRKCIKYLYFFMNFIQIFCDIKIIFLFFTCNSIIILKFM